MSCSSTAANLLNDPDSYWHIVVGNWIVAHHAFPTHDPFSFTFAGAPWIAKEWLSQVLYAGAHALAGWPGMVMLAAAAIALAFALLTRFLLADLRPLYALLLRRRSPSCSPRPMSLRGRMRWPSRSWSPGWPGSSAPPTKSARRRCGCCR